MPVRLSARPSSTVCRPQPNTLSAWRASPPQYFSVISASKERRVAPVIFEAAKRISALCSGVGDGRNRWRGAGMNARAPHKRVRRQKSKSIICGGIVMVISFQEIALVLYAGDTQRVPNAVYELRNCT